MHTVLFTDTHSEAFHILPVPCSWLLVEMAVRADLLGHRHVGGFQTELDGQ